MIIRNAVDDYYVCTLLFVVVVAYDVCAYSLTYV
jgi:hypothetical protein